MIYRLKDLFFEYTPAEPVISPFKPINRPLKTDWYNGTTYITTISRDVSHLPLPPNPLNL